MGISRFPICLQQFGLLPASLGSENVFEHKRNVPLPENSLGFFDIIVT